MVFLYLFGFGRPRRIKREKKKKSERRKRRIGRRRRRNVKEIRGRSAQRRMTRIVKI